MKSLTDKEREKAFPVHIDLGRKSELTKGPTSPSGKKGAPKKYYPSVYIEAIPGLENLPKAGCMLVEFVRKRLSIEDGPDGEEQAGVTLELRRICLAKDGDEDEYDEPTDLAGALGNKAEAETEEDDEEDE